MIIGTGPGGYTVVLKAAESGLKVVIIEAKKTGGTYVNRGCIPTKALLRVSSMLHMMQSCDGFGVSMNFVSFDFGKTQKYKKSVVVKYRDGTKCGSKKLSAEIVHRIAVLRRDGTAEVKLEENGRGFLRGSAVIIATGTVLYMSRVLSTDLTGVWSSDRLLAAESRNFDRLTIMDGGVTAVEPATMFSNLCSHVTIMEKQKHLMAPMDDMMSAELEGELCQKGIGVYCDAMVTEILEDKGGLGCVITPNGEGGPIKVRAGQIFMAIGRRPNVEKLLGKDISLEMEGGKIVVNSDFKIGKRGIYAIGDVSARTQLVHTTVAQGTYVMEKVAGRPRSIKLEIVPNGMYAFLPTVPNCIYTDPEIAIVGITEEIAREKGLKVRCGCFSMRENGKSIITGGENGFIRLVLGAHSSAIMGAQMMCPGATDMIREIATTIANGLSAEGTLFAMRAQLTYNRGIEATIEDAMGKK